jgi:hypothetical protein
MRRSVLAAVAAAAALLVSSVTLATTAGAAPPPQPGLSHRNTHVCGAPVPGTASCNAIRDDVVDSNGKPAPAVTGPTRGYRMSDLRDAYNLPTGTTGGTVAIVDAYDHPYAAQDLNTYRAAMGLGPCSTGCFTKMNQDGATSTRLLPRANGGWAQEISLDLDMATAACPGCKILLVEARSASFSDLATAVNTAAKQPDVVAISNSYGGAEAGTASFAGAYQHEGIAVTASTGDSGYGAQVPAAFPEVVAVGGTSLTNTSGAWSEKAWSGAGSGCSASYAKPTYQTGVTQCGKKAVADVSAVADPNTGVAVYDSYAYQGYVGWMVFGGTSASAPFIAGLYAQNHDFGSSAAKYTWSKAAYPTQDAAGNRLAGNMHDVDGGDTNGTCSTSLWCTSGAGWDGPTGLGTPNGTGAF